MNPEKKSYRSSIKLTEYMEKKLQHLKDLEKIERKKSLGEDLEELKNAVAKKYKNINTEKTRLLDDTIFPSMANLIVFFEYLTKYPQLRELFEKDVKELFGYIKEPWDRNKEDQIEYNKRTCIIRRFMESLLTWDSKKDPNNFRSELILELQKSIVKTIGEHFLNIEYGTIHGIIAPNVFRPDGIVIADLARAEAWTKIYASKYSDSEQAIKDREDIPSRPVAF